MFQDILLASLPASWTDAFDVDHILTYVLVAMLISIFVMLFYNRLYVFRERDMESLGKSQNERLALVLQTGNLRLWLYDVVNRHYIILSKKGEYNKEYNPVEFSQFFDRDDFEVMRSKIFDICEGRLMSAKVSLKSFALSNGEYRSYEVNMSIADVDEDGKIKSLLGIEHDITDEVEKQKKVSQLLIRYHNVFNTSLIDMLYYDKHGVLQDINEKACQTFGVKAREDVLQGNFLLVDNPFFSDVNGLEGMKDTRSTSILDFEDLKEERYRTEELGLKGRMYYESAVNPIRDEKGRLQGVYIAGRNVTEMVESYHRQQEGMAQLQQVTKDIENYIRDINYALRVSDVRMVNYYPGSYTMEISNNVDQTQLHLSQLRCIRLATIQFRRKVSSVLNRMDHRTPHALKETIETEIRDKKGRQIWLMFHMVPMRDSEGHIERYFGLCRNMTDMMETERRLAVETAKAQETELLKQSFLTNMSYEIRTPLNTVVGFAELFESEHNEADEPVFVEEIKRNSNSLLQLVNDILFLSRLDANMIEYNKGDVDLALFFDGYCQLGWSSVGPEVKTVVENPYECLVVDIDQEHLGMVIQKLCTNAVRYTHQGTIRARYEYRHKELAISIEDTGRGVDEKVLAKVFDRFARNDDGELCGTGLDLPIVKALVEQMGGTVELQSELGKGSTFWVILPCTAKTLQKKREIII